MKPWEKFEDTYKTINGYICKIRKNYLDCLCGYVFIPKENKAYKELEKYPENIECHGDITYDSFEIFGGVKYRVIGFDCAHSWDYVPAFDKDSPKLNKGKVWRDEEYVENELVEIIEQLSKIDPYPDYIARLLGRD